MRKSELKGLEVKEVSLVDRAANKRKFLMTKSERGENMHEVFKELLETEAIGEPKLAEVIKCLSPEAQQAVTGALRLLQGFSDEIPMDVFASLMGLCAGDEMGEAEVEMILNACKTRKSEDGKKDGAAEPIEKAVTPFGNLPLADRNMPWDGTAAEKRVREAAMKGSGEGKDAMDWAMYRKAFLYTGEDPENFTDYKFQIGDIVDGEMKAVPRGIFAAAAALQGARMGPGQSLTVDKAAQDGMKSVLTRYYDKMAKEFEDDSIMAPWAEKQEKSESIKKEAKTVDKVNIFKADGTIDMEAVPEEMKDSVEKLFKQMTDAQELIKKAEDEKVTREYVAKAAEYKNLAVKPEEFGLTLKALATAAPAEYTKLEAVLKAADAALTKGGLFAEIGTSGGGEQATAWGKIEKAAEARAAKENITKAEAVSKILDENPALYNEYLTEKGAK